MTTLPWSPHDGPHTSYCQVLHAFHLQLKKNIYIIAKGLVFACP